MLILAGLAVVAGALFLGYMVFTFIRDNRQLDKWENERKLDHDQHDRLTTSLIELQKQFQEQNAHLGEAALTALWKPVADSVIKSLVAMDPDSDEDPLAHLYQAVKLARKLVGASGTPSESVE